MKLLAIDTSGVAMSGAVSQDGRILDRFGCLSGKNHSVDLLPEVRAMLDRLGMTLSSLDAFGVTVGPGSFTGLRIGIATVKAWCDSLDKPAVAVSSLTASAHIAHESGLVCPIFDARRNEVYTALFRNGERLTSDEAIQPELLAQRLALLEEPVFFTGDALPVCGDLFAAVLGAHYHPLPLPHALFMAEPAALLACDAAQSGRFTALQELLPVYLRLSEAEEKRNARLADRGDK